MVNASLISNYRPVSGLPCFSKIFESLMYNRLISFINKHNLLYKYQFGFKKGNSTNMALILLVDKISEAIQKGEYVLGVFLDFSKAFDTINHNILCRKLECYGIRGMALQWISSYLSDRSQFVIYDNVKSPEKHITCGVPQGSILGPLLFLLYVNDIVNVSTLLFPMLFADDTNVFLNGKDIDELSVTMNEELEKLYIWLKANKLSLNVNKTYYMVFRSVKKKVFQPLIQLMINGQVISQVDNTKFLGVILDINLNWSSHINQIRSKIAKGIGIIYKTRKLLKENTLLTLYYSFVYPYFQYCIEVWGTTFKCYLDTLVKLQKRAVRCITFSNRLAHTDPLFSKLKILKLSEIYSFCISLFMFKFNKNLLPTVFDDMFTLNENIHLYRTRQSLTLHVPLCRSVITSKTIRYKGVSIWNTVIKFIGLNYSLFTFKRKLRHYLFQHGAIV